MSATVLLLGHAMPLLRVASMLIAAGVAPGILESRRSTKTTPKKESKPKKAKPDRHGFRGTPEPPKFSLAELPDDALITETETAGYLRVAKSTVAEWRLRPDHPLKWLVLPGGFVRTTAGWLRAYMATGVRRRRTDLIAARAADEQSAINQEA